MWSGGHDCCDLRFVCQCKRVFDLRYHNLRHLRRGWEERRRLRHCRYECGTWADCTSFPCLCASWSRRDVSGGRFAGFKHREHDVTLDRSPPVPAGHLRAHPHLTGDAGGEWALRGPHHGRRCPCCISYRCYGDITLLHSVDNIPVM